MTTFREYAEKYLRRGLSEKVSKEILNSFETNNKDMQTRMSDSTSDYPEAVTSLMTIELDMLVLKWMDENCPNHWARLAFMPRTESQSEGE